MSFGNMTTMGGRPPRRRDSRRRRGRLRGRPQPQLYNVSDLVAAYLAGLAAVCVSLVLAGPLAILVYFIAGIALTRFISNRVRWWIIKNSVQNVAAVKLRNILIWPISVPPFIFMVAAAKWL